MEMVETATAFFEACESGHGAAACAPYCTVDAGFSSQAEPLAEIATLSAYADWMRWLLGVLPDGSYQIRSVTVDPAKAVVAFFAVFTGTHIGTGGPVPPTGRQACSDYVYVMEFDGGKICHVTKIWNAGWALRQLGWA